MTDEERLERVNAIMNRVHLKYDGGFSFGPVIMLPGANPRNADDDCFKALIYATVGEVRVSLAHERRRRTKKGTMAMSRFAALVEGKPDDMLFIEAAA
ncbi:hypothetical protein [Ensifer adhaerens]|jgi:hypothetical protein|uniref:hypothetical protein n=1 Tax=Ensifer adhaerens TaxID=106592 RepID=UPI00202E4964|nr:hypothetical protein [Ensifer adhaerens]